MSPRGAGFLRTFRMPQAVRVVHDKPNALASTPCAAAALFKLFDECERAHKPFVVLPILLARLHELPEKMTWTLTRLLPRRDLVATHCLIADAHEIRCLRIAEVLSFKKPAKKIRRDMPLAPPPGQHFDASPGLSTRSTGLCRIDKAITSRVDLHVPSHYVNKMLQWLGIARQAYSRL